MYGFRFLARLSSVNKTIIIIIIIQNIKLLCLTWQDNKHSMSATIETIFYIIMSFLFPADYYYRPKIWQNDHSNPYNNIENTTTLSGIIIINITIGNIINVA